MARSIGLARSQEPFISDDLMVSDSGFPFTCTSDHHVTFEHFLMPECFD